MNQNEKIRGNEKGVINGEAEAKPLQSLEGFTDLKSTDEKINNCDTSSKGGEIGNDANSVDSKNSDLFSDLTNLRLEQNFAHELGLAKPLATVPVKKPGKTCFIRVHPDTSYRFQAAVIDYERETYLVTKKLWPHLINETAFVPKILITYMSRPGDVLSLWPMRLPGPDGRLDEYNQSALHIGLSLATKSWTRVNANLNLGAYEATIAPAGISWGEPNWPDMPFTEILRLAFRDKVIEDINHPVLKKLRGEQ